MTRDGEHLGRGTDVTLSAWLPAGRVTPTRRLGAPVSVRRLVLALDDWPPDEWADHHRPAYWHYGLLRDGQQPNEVPGWQPYTFPFPPPPGSS
jgi:hypothetical protein